MGLICGIYSITSIFDNSKTYIGSAANFYKRKSGHLKTLKGDRHANKILQNHYNKYGVSDLVFSVLEECDTEALIEREQYYLDTLSPFFNILKIADRRTGVAHNVDTKLKISVSLTGRKASEETRLKMSKSHLGNKSNLGRKLPEEHKNNISNATKGNRNCAGKKQSEETKRKRSASLKGRVISEDHKNKLRLANTGLKHSIERRENNRQAQLGKKLSDEHKLNIKKGLLKRKELCQQHPLSTAQVTLGLT